MNPPNQPAQQHSNGCIQNWLALIQDRLGPDVWGCEVDIDAVDFMDAARQAQRKAEYYGGYVVSMERTIL